MSIIFDKKDKNLRTYVVNINMCILYFVCSSCLNVENKFSTLWVRSDKFSSFWLKKMFRTFDHYLAYFVFWLNEFLLFFFITFFFFFYFLASALANIVKPKYVTLAPRVHFLVPFLLQKDLFYLRECFLRKCKKRKINSANFRQCSFCELTAVIISLLT